MIPISESSFYSTQGSSLLRSFDKFLSRLSRLKWSPPGSIDPGLVCLLAELANERAVIGNLVESWDTEDLEKRQLRCHETSTHYKWFVYYHKHLRYRIWLHQYKDTEARQPGYAEVPHNHRYSLASVVLRGGFEHRYFARDVAGLSEIESERRFYVTGEAYALEWQKLHMLSALRDHTLTLVVESPVVRNFSEAFYDVRSQPVLFHDFVGLHPRLAEATRTW